MYTRRISITWLDLVLSNMGNACGGRAVTLMLTPHAKLYLYNDPPCGGTIY